MKWSLQFVTNKNNSFFEVWSFSVIVSFYYMQYANKVAILKQNTSLLRMRKEHCWQMNYLPPWHMWSTQGFLLLSFLWTWFNQTSFAGHFRMINEILKIDLTIYPGQTLYLLSQSLAILRQEPKGLLCVNNTYQEHLYQ